MKKETIIGVFFIVILALVVVFGLITLFKRPFYTSETIILTKSGEEPITSINVDLDNGIIVIIQNETIAGWKVIAEYSEKDAPPQITADNESLSVYLKNGKIRVESRLINSLEWSLDNGIVTVVITNSSAEIHGTVVNGKISAILIGDSYSIDLSLTNGYLSVNAKVNTINGAINVANGDVSFILETNSGGTISYNVKNGDALIVPGEYTISQEKVNNGVRGVLSKDGEGVDVEISVLNGNISIIIVKRED